MKNKEKPLINNEKYENYEYHKINIKLIHIIFHYILNLFNQSHKKYLSNTYSIPTQFLEYFLSKQTQTISDDIVIIPLGHATVLIIYNGIKILIDPILNRCSYFFKRYINPISTKYLGAIDIIIFSHNHPDHFNKDDLLYITSLSPFIKIFGPAGFSELFTALHISTDQLTTLLWWEKSNIIIKDKTIIITYLPAIHWSQSSLENRNKSLWASCMITINGKNIYFSGDTAYGEHFQTISSYYYVNLALIGIAPYKPAALQHESHLNCEDAYQVFLDLQKPIFIPIHWGVFAYGEEPLKEPIQEIITIFHKNENLHKLQSTVINQPFIIKNQ